MRARNITGNLGQHRLALRSAVRSVQFGRVEFRYLGVERIDGIEFYASASQAPGQYARLNANCGVMVIHTRRGR